ncbi:hypothetical protein TGAM01_v205259 [Trichoderma gamsii]|uniref:Uncharacterized protein n=1 Tax=Trichoderma gamsii TaxID=398673 RepID=A0A2P4ZNE7_9HYPO|nr:hypothetical protein TGAM01_v205259 [Trichoderma gamsii]PON25822.1 hypothetical protein TGAM01_v205259 [Trichoderma gamsii]
MYGINCFTYTVSGSCLLISKGRPFAYTAALCDWDLYALGILQFLVYSLHHLPSLFGVRPNPCTTHFN